MLLGSSRVDDRTRLYAIGDIHGCLDLLDALTAEIDADLAADPPERHRLVFLGDYVDRGPDSAGVLGRLIDLKDSGRPADFVRGNHDRKLLDFLADPAGEAPGFFAYGGVETLASYGCESFGAGVDELAAEARDEIPDTHTAFLAAAVSHVRHGDYFFCHAGVRPGVALAAQDADDLMWIRGPFLDSAADFGAVVVHGHTPTAAPDIRPNRIGVDTGAVFGGALTALVLEGAAYRFLQVT